jgi:hypothetical protein
VIANLNRGATITHASDYDSIHSLTSSIINPGTIAITGGSLSIATQSPLDSNTTLSLSSSGEITGRGDLTLDGLFDWAGGTISGPGAFNANGGMSLSGTGYRYIDARTVNNAGVATWNGGGMTFYGRAVFNNLPGASFRVQVAQSLSGDGIFNNQAGATFEKSVDPGVVTVSAPFNNNGTINVQAGNLKLAGGGASDGTFTVSAMATLTFDGGSHSLTPRSNISGAGAVVFDAGSVEENGTYAITGSTSFIGGSADFPGTVTSLGNSLMMDGYSTTANFESNTVTVGTLTMSNGTLLGVGDVAVTTSLTWTGGTMADTGSTSIMPGAALSISGTGSRYLDTRTLNNTGMGMWTDGGSVSFYNGAVMNNLTGASFSVQVDQNLSGDGTFNNRAGATLEKANSSGLMTVGARLNNDGTVDVQTGNLRLNGGGTSDGTFTVAAVAALTFGGGTQNLTLHSNISGAGTVVFDGGSVEENGTYAITGTTSFTGGSGADFPGTVTSLGSSLTMSSYSATANFESNSVTVGTLTMSNGTLTGVGDVAVTTSLIWTGGTMADTGSTSILAGATLSISGAGSRYLDTRTLNNAGGATWIDAGTFTLSNGAIINNLQGGIFRLQANQSSFGGSGAFNNQAGAMFQKSQSTGTTTMSLPFNNDGTVELQSGTLVLAGGSTSGGSFTVTAPASLGLDAGTHRLLSGSSVNGTGTVSFTAGRTYIDGGYTISGSTNVTGYSTEVTFSGDAGTGPFTNGTPTTTGGTVTIDVGSTFSVTGSYVQASGTTDMIEATLIASAVNINGGTFWASGTLTGDLVNGGTLNLGWTSTADTLNVNGSYTQTHGGVLNIKLGDPSAGATSDQLNISGTAMLDGTLAITRLDNFTPPPMSSFRILTFAFSSGEFSSLMGIDPFTYHHNLNDVTLTT